MLGILVTWVWIPLETLFHKFKPTLSFARAPWWTYSSGERFSTISCNSLIEKLVDTLFVHHHQTSTKWGAKRDGGSSNKVETIGGPTVGGESNHESKYTAVWTTLKFQYSSLLMSLILFMNKRPRQFSWNWEVMYYTERIRLHQKCFSLFKIISYKKLTIFNNIL